MKVLGLILLSIFTWLAVLVPSAVLVLIGAVVCWVAAGPKTINGKTLYPNMWYLNVSRFNRVLLEWTSPLMWVWGNDEDGIDGLRGADPAQQWWKDITQNDSMHVRIWRWSAIRNPVGNLRFVPFFGFIINPKLVGYVGNSLDPDADFGKKPGFYWYFAWCSWRTGLWVIFPYLIPFKKKYGQIRLGWKIIPRDVNGVDPTDYRSKGCGTALQLSFNKG